VPPLPELPGRPSSATTSAPPDAAAVEAWLGELGLEPAVRVERDGLTAWDVILDGRRRFDLRFTLIHDPSAGVIVWLPYAPPVTDGYRKSYEQLLRWNDELPYVKFGLDSEARLVLSTELPGRGLDAWSLGLAFARLVAVCDYLLEASAHWLFAESRIPPPERPSRGASLLDRYAFELTELLEGRASPP
jgi:hypothetical protein